MSPAMRYTIIKNKDAIARKAARHYNIKTAAALTVVLALGIGPLGPTIGHWLLRTVEHTDPANPVAAVLTFALGILSLLFTVALLLARLATIFIITPALAAAFAVYTYDRFAKATGRWPYDIPPLGVETLRTKHGNDTPIEYDPHTGTSTAYQPNGQVLQQIQHDTDKNHPYRH
ncbi:MULTISPECIES: cytochrome d ubiquinol oxidase subunit II [unclassified Rhodococcus (in: high G+C Gram-positive bacteria)]|uniref:cytochrome d ubiquinol oxidase subunit II n=1 Tax=unclassified Rhodococcus (in: high G+C Gram-positive bacteria) TaxID=192944 RepID=UPI0011401AB6|nr:MULTISPECIES: cytochrome d ubiquinol oxidase subunit II [unclassified Rhodococcus (in: high G+C Gram-positive bacteria)]